MGRWATGFVICLGALLQNQAPDGRMLVKTFVRHPAAAAAKSARSSSSRSRSDGSCCPLCLTVEDLPRLPPPSPPSDTATDASVRDLASLEGPADSASTPG